MEKRFWVNGFRVVLVVGKEERPEKSYELEKALISKKSSKLPGMIGLSAKLSHFSLEKNGKTLHQKQR
jgi:hypothetical protein